MELDSIKIFKDLDRIVSEWYKVTSANYIESALIEFVKSRVLIDKQNRLKPEWKCYLQDGEWWYKGAPWGWED